ncbi:hypothetical protein [Enterobacteriaceae endosymbiont of Neohaemonia nigricornis]|uniref:hypothetical protein n=1 Tax=Enterobacteriaceae endosymbiont of Neohaemonia nigricornis TaxID=2675792 RepID=UPI00144A026A|nr:hypothetical protein [Enterobacteriaceae endosymbiont of Neohaemonia nigricornis]QJC30399.1 hypothetical protein GJT85_01045 [Enterobacteriaceae endosymbiont of Neohaemonia nigricornis]
MNIIDMLWKSVLIIKLILLILIIMFIISLFIIIQKYLLINKTLYLLTNFKKKIWSGNDISNIYKEIQLKKDDIFGIEKIFYKGFKKFIYTYNYITNIPEIIIKDTKTAINLCIKKEFLLLNSYMIYLNIIYLISQYIISLGNVYILFYIIKFLINLKFKILLYNLLPNLITIIVMIIMSLIVKIITLINYKIINQYIEHIILKYNNFTQEILSIFYKKIFLKKTFINYNK